MLKESSKLKIKRVDLQSYADILNSMSRLPGYEFAKLINANRATFFKEMKKVDVALELPTDSNIFEFRKQEQNLIRKHCKLDANNQPMKDQQGMFIFHDDNAFMADYESLKKAHPEAVSTLTSHSERIENFMEEEIEIDIYKISEKEVSSMINADQLQRLEPFLEQLIPLTL